MTERTIIQMQNPVTQSIDAVKSLLTWRGRGTDPMPATVEFVQEGEGCVVLVLSNKKDSYYVVTPAKCSCPAATYHRASRASIRGSIFRKSRCLPRRKRASGPNASGRVATMDLWTRSLGRLSLLSWQIFFLTGSYYCKAG